MFRFFLASLFLLFYAELLAQTSTQEINILFYNTENLFDIEDDPTIEDDEFLPEGDRHWNSYRLRQKLNSLSKVILNCAGFIPPDIVGVCEVENRIVLEQLLANTPLNRYNYSIIHKDSPDERGIDVALFFRDDQLTPLTYHYVPILDKNRQVEETREILYASFLCAEGQDTLHLFFNHWPSRYRGQAATEEDRMQAAITLRKEVDRLIAIDSKVKIVIMGDFNDQPRNNSLIKGLQARENDNLSEHGELLNLSAGWKQGTIKYRQTWSVFDQIIVSDGLLQAESWNTSYDGASVVSLPFLFVEDAKYKGRKLFRTYNGFSYQGGFSDHLPILLKIKK
ncbi:endonuclease/exonuclease/phosphatase family protein [Sunxiuqinia indica]|uniref:endonuclease/exonuclease/phosphatase family protein n=1 Tax=Sunxiuqinia indica TaxID=2692584 RepID=UPI00135C37D1|nr:endonuclease/exonuclease/phosphatase family protein [Sunxiuqinia indica]